MTSTKSVGLLAIATAASGLASGALSLAAASQLAEAANPTTSVPSSDSLLPGASKLDSLLDSAHFYTVGVFEKYGDPRVAHYRLMRTPWPTILATCLYYWFVRSIGPRLMRDKKPYEILPLIRLYNLLMAAWNGFGFYTGCQLLNYGADCIGCRPVDPTRRDELTLTQIYYGWMFFTSRLVEFADTIFFTLRKKESQVTSFHVFHHSSVPTTCWFFLKFAPGGNSAVFPFINTLVHTIMYTYYFLATYPSMRPYLGWKKYLTQMQIVQFLIIIACCMQPLVIPGCKFPRVLLLIMVAFCFVFIYLFVDFYLKSYNQQKKQQHQSMNSTTPNSASHEKHSQQKQIQNSTRPKTANINEKKEQ